MTRSTPKTASNFGIYSRSLVFFLVAATLIFGLVYFWQSFSLQADQPPTLTDPRVLDEQTLTFNLLPDGTMVQGKSRQDPEIFSTDATYRYRLQVLNRPNEFQPEFRVAVILPQNVTEETVAHRFINNGGALQASSELVENRAILFEATEISSEAQLAIEFELPKTFVTPTAASQLRERLAGVSPVIWTGVSVAFPALSGLLLLLIMASRNRKVAPLKEEITEPPSYLSPALVGILLRGRITSRELAATLLDLARRGHLAIHHYSIEDFRFRRLNGTGKLEDFEQVLLDQIFGVTGQKASAEEVSFSIAQEIFSKRVSQAFILAYKKINDLGFFYTNPLRLHRRYQLAGLLLFVVGAIGFFATLFLFTAVPGLLIIWFGMVVSSLLVTFFARTLPSRTVFGDRELAKWLAFANYMSQPGPVSYAAHSQENYLHFLPYAVALECEVEWTSRFYELPFAQPSWYLAANISTIDQFANKVFPLFGYLSHVLALSSQPASR